MIPTECSWRALRLAGGRARRRGDEPGCGPGRHARALLLVRLISGLFYPQSEGLLTLIRIMAIEPGARGRIRRLILIVFEGDLGRHLL